MNIYIYNLFINHYITVEKITENNRLITRLQYPEIGPFDIPEPSHFKEIKEALQHISSTEITSNWWTDFSSWEDFHGVFRTGSKLSMHSVVIEVNTRLKSIKHGFSYIDQIDENGNIVIELHEMFTTLMKGYQIRARRRKLRTLKQIASYNVAKYISSEDDIKQLHIPQSLNKLIATFLDTYSVDYMRM